MPFRQLKSFLKILIGVQYKHAKAHCLHEAVRFSIENDVKGERGCAQIPVMAARTSTSIC